MIARWDKTVGLVAREPLVNTILVEYMSTAAVCYANSLKPEGLRASFELETRFVIAIIAVLTRGLELLLPSGYSVDLVDCDCLAASGGQDLEFGVCAWAGLSDFSVLTSLRISSLAL